MSLKLRIRWQGKCPKHPRFNPEKDGESGIKGGCSFCALLLGISGEANELAARTQAFDEAAGAGK